MYSKDSQNVAVRGLRLRKKVLQYPVRHDVDSDDDKHDGDNDEDFQIEDNNCSSNEESDGTSREGELLSGNLSQNKTFGKFCLIFKHLYQRKVLPKIMKNALISLKTSFHSEDILFFVYISFIHFSVSHWSRRQLNILILSL